MVKCFDRHCRPRIPNNYSSLSYVLSDREDRCYIMRECRLQLLPKKKKAGYVCFCNVSNLQTLWSHKKGILLFTSLIEIYIGKTNYKDDFNSENLNYMKIRRF